MLKVKICGLRRIEDIKIVNELLPDYIGFVFTPSSRQVTVQEAKALKNLLRPEIKAVGVFVNTSVEEIVSLVNDKVIDLVQLHGYEDVFYCQTLREKIKVPIIKAIPLKDEQTLENLAVFACDYFLFDTYVAGKYGGSGQVGNISLLEGKKIPKPYFLAGGLTAQNVSEALAHVEAFAVDVSGGVEVDGYKDRDKIADFLQAVRVGSKYYG